MQWSVQCLSPLMCCKLPPPGSSRPPHVSVNAPLLLSVMNAGWVRNAAYRQHSGQRPASASSKLQVSIRRSVVVAVVGGFVVRAVENLGGTVPVASLAVTLAIGAVVTLGGLHVGLKVPHASGQHSFMIFADSRVSLSWLGFHSDMVESQYAPSRHLRRFAQASAAGVPCHDGLIFLHVLLRDCGRLSFIFPKHASLSLHRAVVVVV